MGGKEPILVMRRRLEGEKNQIILFDKLWHHLKTLLVITMHLSKPSHIKVRDEKGRKKTRIFVGWWLMSHELLMANRDFNIYFCRSWCFNLNIYIKSCSFARKNCTLGGKKIFCKKIFCLQTWVKLGRFIWHVIKKSQTWSSNVWQKICPCYLIFFFAPENLSLNFVWKGTAGTCTELTSKLRRL